MDALALERTAIQEIEQGKEENSFIGKSYCVHIKKTPEEVLLPKPIPSAF